MRVVAAVFDRFCDEREIPKKENKQKEKTKNIQKNIKIRIFLKNNFIIVLLIGQCMCYNIITGKH